MGLVSRTDGGDRWKKGGSVSAGDLAGLLVVGLVLFQRLIREGDLTLQFVKARVLENLPPRATQSLVVGRRGLPASSLTIGHRGGDRRPLIAGSDRAAGNQQ